MQPGASLRLVRLAAVLVLPLGGMPPTRSISRSCAASYMVVELQVRIALQQSPAVRRAVARPVPGLVRGDVRAHGDEDGLAGSPKVQRCSRSGRE
jgi:hypothetical protein